MKKARLPVHLTRVRKESGHEDEKEGNGFPWQREAVSNQRRPVTTSSKLGPRRAHVCRTGGSWQYDMDSRCPSSIDSLLGLEQRNVVGSGCRRRRCHCDTALLKGG